MFEIRILVRESYVHDPFLPNRTEEVLQYRIGEYLEEDEEGWKDVPKEYVVETAYESNR